MKSICPSACCTSCGTCTLICPVGAIKMCKDAYGINKPQVQESLCIDCGLCERKCPVNNAVSLHMPDKCYAAFDRDRDRVQDSASGGVAYLLYYCFLKNFQKSVVYGVCLNKDLKPEYRSCDNIDELDVFRGSIYVQADIYKIFTSVREKLEAGFKVLIVGLPCQIAGIRRFLEVKHTSTGNLILIDLLCHGIVPYEYFSKELQGVMKCSKHGKISSISFRSNRKEDNYFLKYTFEDGYVLKRHSSCDYYFNGFVQNILLQDSCYTCHYSQHSRVGDLTIGDFIGLDRNSIDEKNRKRNISVIMVNSECGKNMLRQCTDELKLIEQPVEAGLKGPSFNGASKPHVVRESFRRDYLNNGYYNAIRKNTAGTILCNRIKFKVKQVIKKIVRHG